MSEKKPMDMLLWADSVVVAPRSGVGASACMEGDEPSTTPYIDSIRACRTAEMGGAVDVVFSAWKEADSWIIEEIAALQAAKCPMVRLTETHCTLWGGLCLPLGIFPGALGSCANEESCSTSFDAYGKLECGGRSLSAKCPMVCPTSTRCNIYKRRKLLTLSCLQCR